ncbi:uncharacterized protein LOC120294942 [Eucalyptus grandis]|uniref:Uncharacterized protein n=3 Tax=Eucalyptus TaxID=3932 RepID=A0A059BZQ0_EUCGR|nr:uncharacterized protein LOC120294942 [Eucalyptus grandis]KAK3428466.1 hypothetical protein EUGRSUZ_F04485 [Eucalyptus grandis]
MSGAQGAEPKESKTATTYESVEGGENRTRTDIRMPQDQGGIQVDMLQEKVPDATGYGGPVFGAGAAASKTKDEEAEDKQKLDLGVTGTG